MRPQFRHSLGAAGRRLRWPPHQKLGDARFPVDVDSQVVVNYPVLCQRPAQRFQGDALPVRRAVRLRGQFPGAVSDRRAEVGPRRQFVDKSPLQRPVPSDAFGRCAEKVGVVAAHPPLVHQPGQTPGAGQHGKQRQLGQRHRARSIVDQHDVLTGKGQLVPSPCRRAVDRADVGLSGVGRGVFYGVPGLVGELAEVHLEGVAGLRQHPDVGPGAKHPVVPRCNHHRAHAGMLKPQPLHRVVELDVHAQVVGILLQLIAWQQRRVLPDRQRQPSHPPVDGQRPMLVPPRAGGKVYHGVIAERSRLALSLAIRPLMMTPPVSQVSGALRYGKYRYQVGPGFQTSNRR